MLRSTVSQRAARVLALLCSAVSLTGCIISKPSPREMLEIGLRTPEQTFHTFQLAVRADEPALEHRCFSRRVTAELSQIAWREFREELWGRFGSRWAVVHAQALGPARVHGASAELDVEVLGRQLRLAFVRQDFGEVWAGERAVVDDFVDWHTATGVQTRDTKRWLFGQLPLPADADANALSEVRVGREWKLDEITELDGS